MARVRANFVRGTVSDSPLTIASTTFNSASLANLPEVAGTDIAVVVIDPLGSAPEVVYVTAHTAAATVATISRGQESSSAAEWPAGTAWVHGATARDLNYLSFTNYDETVNTVAAAGTTETIDLDNGSVHDITLDENVTFTFTNPPAAGRAISFTVILRQDGTGTNTVTWPASVVWPGGSAPTITATASAVDIVVFTTVDGGTTYYGNVAGQAYA